MALARREPHASARRAAAVAAEDRGQHAYADAGPCPLPSPSLSGGPSARPPSSGAACRRATAIPRTQDASSSGTAWQLCCCARILCASPRGGAFWHPAQSRREGAGRTVSRSTAPLAVHAPFCCHPARRQLRHARRSSPVRILQSRAAGLPGPSTSYDRGSQAAGAPADKPPTPCRPGTVHAYVTGRGIKKDCSGRPGAAALVLVSHSAKV